MKFLEGKPLVFRGDRLLVFEPTRVLGLRAWPDPATLTGPDEESCRLPCDLRVGLAEIEELANSGRADAAVACTALLESLPAELRPVLENLPEHAWRLLSLVWGGQGAPELVKSNLGLAFAIACRTELKTRLDGEGWLSAGELLAMKRKHAAGWLELPPNEGAVKTLARLAPEATRVPEIRRIRTLLISGDPRAQKKLAHLPRINVDVLEILSDPELEKLVGVRLLEEICGSRSSEAHVADRVRRVKLGFGAHVAPRKSIDFPVLSSLAELARTSAEVDEVARKVAKLRSTNDARLAFPAPPIPGNEYIQPLDSVEALIDEGVAQENCAGDYARFVRSGSLYVYRVLEPERCTLSITRFENRWLIDQLRRRRNLTPESPATRRIVERWIKDHAQRTVILGSGDSGVSADLLPAPPVPWSVPPRRSDASDLLDKPLRFDRGRLLISDGFRALSLRAWPNPKITDVSGSKEQPVDLALGLAAIDERARGDGPGAAECRALLERIPAKVRVVVVRFEDEGWLLLAGVFSAPKLLETLKSEPALGFAIACRARLSGGRSGLADEPVEVLLSKPRPVILERLGLSAKVAALLGRVAHDAITVENLGKLTRLATAEGRVAFMLEQARRINRSVLELLSDERTSALIDPSFLAEASEDSRGRVGERVRALLRESTISSPNQALPLLRRLEDLDRWQGRLEAGSRERVVRANAAGLRFPHPPFPGNGTIEPLETMEAFLAAVDADQLKWAIAQGGSVASGLSYVYRMNVVRDRLVILYRGENTWRLTRLLGRGMERWTEPSRREESVLVRWLRVHGIGNALFQWR
ncbi:MAG: PcfJ domain-containing protein [Deltaproteobacteria bacterium]|nr:PcfJ domain-containing protein [Deltaproteobacteria bacterium]